MLAGRVPACPRRVPARHGGGGRMAAQTQVVHRSLDGRRMQLAGPLDLGMPATSVLGVAIGGRPQEFTSGVAALGDEVATALGAGGFDEELSYAGGTLLVGRL